MDISALLNQVQFALAIIGVIVTVIWFFCEKHRIRYAPVMWCIWCIVLVIYRLYRWNSPNGLSIHSSLASSIFMLGLVSIIFIGISNIVEVFKHGFK